MTIPHFDVHWVTHTGHPLSPAHMFWPLLSLAHFPSLFCIIRALAKRFTLGLRALLSLLVLLLYTQVTHMPVALYRADGNISL